MTDRRRFLLRATAAAGASLTLRTPASARAAAARRPSPAESIRVGLIGCGGRGTYHIGNVPADAAVVVAVCDVEESHRGQAAQIVGQAGGRAPAQHDDFRRVLDDPAIDAVILATPHHWHAPIAIRALAAGKHVYCEKPASHVLDEGKAVVAAAARAGKIFQHGTQMRSSPVTEAAGDLLRSGKLGRILMTTACGVEPRSNWPDPVPDSAPPAGLDWERWLGPVPSRPYNASHHRRWNDFKLFGNGEIGGDGIHDIDLARWALGVEEHPVKITARGSRALLKGDSDYPDNMLVSWEYPDGRSIVYENRNFAPYGEHGFDNANLFYGTEGYMVFSRRGAFATFLGPKDEPGPSLRGGAGNEEHMAGFFEAIRSGGPSRADARTAHLSCTLVHLGEIAYRTGRTLTFDAQAERIVHDDEAAAMQSKTYRDGCGLDA